MVAGRPSTRVGLVLLAAVVLSVPVLLAAGSQTASAADEGQRMRFAAVASATDYMHIGAALAFALLHLLLFAFYRRERGNLYFAVFALAYAGMTWGGYQLDHPEPDPNVPRLVALLRFTFTCGIVQAFTLQRFAHVEFLERTPRLFHVLLLWGAGVILWVWTVPAESLRIQPVMYLAIATTAELMRTVILAARGPRRPSAWLIYVGLAALALAGLVQSLLALGVFGAFQQRVYAYGVLFFMLAISIYLSRRFATIALELEHQLEEVQRLSVVTLEQEREARRREVESRLLEAENDRRAHELEEARRLQLSMVPSEPPAVPGLEIAVAMETATEVGGDYYDFRVAEDGALTLAVGDATGHGLNAGLVVASTKSLFQGLDAGRSLPESMERIDRGLRGMRLKRLAMSLVLARYREGRLEVAAAGMPPLLVYRRRERRVEECLLAAPPLGTLKARTFESHELQVGEGDAVLLATDGLVELLDPEDRELGYEEAASTFSRVGAASAGDAVAGLLERVGAWASGRPLEDDLTLMVLRRQVR